MSFRFAVAMSLLTVSLSSSAVQGQSLSQTMKQSFGNDYREYQWLDYPVDNFGVATSYYGKKADQKDFLCATFSCLSSSPTGTDGWISAGGYADVGCGGDLNDKFSSQGQASFKAVVPTLLHMVGINLDASHQKSLQGSITSVEVCRRALKQQMMLNHIETLTDDKLGLKRALDRNKLVLIVGDVVIKNLVLSVTADGTTSVSLDAKATQSTGNEAQVSIQKTANHQYQLTVTKPLIAAVLAKRQTDEANRATVDTGANKWEGWSDTTVPVVPVRSSSVPRRPVTKKPS